MTDESGWIRAAEMAAHLEAAARVAAELLGGDDLPVLPCNLCRRVPERDCRVRLSGLSAALGVAAYASICDDCLSRSGADLVELLAVGGEEYVWAQQMREALACEDCPAEVRLTEGKAVLRARVIHSATCPWYRRYQAREVTGRIPCGTVVTHRGPYKRDPEGTR